jgi:small conductance mechanosensitive channel
MLTPYKADIYENTVIIENDIQSGMIIAEEGNARLDENGKKNHFYFMLKNHLQNLTPEKQVTTVLQFFLSTVFLIIMGLYMFRSSSVISFILFGNWKRGFNLMAFSGTILLVLMFLVMVLFQNSLTELMTNILNPKGLTIWKLLVNLIQYLMLILMLYCIFTYLGFNANVLLASFSAFSLAISLGAKDLVADILAGVFLVFEDNFHVNEIIEIDGFRGRVMEIGLRYTKLVGMGENIKIIGNQSVKKIMNLSRLNSWYIMQVKVPADQPLEEIEAMLERELPKIGASIPQVINGPIYKGVIAIDGNNNALSIITECREENFRRVQREVNRAIRLLFQRNGIKIN